ncbi:MAG: [protein-PII] uridylyltransferase [Cellvibrionales bacterium]|nr:[protein-PII] uridylyltransferase [Cellvibrionales bacterium]
MSALLFFDEQRFQKALEQGKPVTVFRDAIQAANTHFDNRFYEGEDVRTLVNERARFVDRLLHFAWQHFEIGDTVSLIAVGGYGRMELHPHSDIDVLILLPSEPDAETRHTLERFITFLWDLNLNIGHSVRTMAECIQAAADDITIATNLLESRTLAGNRLLRTTLRTEIDARNIWPSREFFYAKWQEQRERHTKHNNTEYNLEPNIKNAPGGLRDIQTIMWIAKRHFNLEKVSDLVRVGFLTENEFNIMRNGEELLWRVRYGLHLLAGRHEERLSFDYQRALAAEFGYRDTEKSLAVEQFMKRYYRAVSALRELNDVLLNFLDESLSDDDNIAEIIDINRRFRTYNNYIEVKAENVFRQTPAALLEIFVLMGQNPQIKGVRASTIRLIREHRQLIDDNYRQDIRNTSLFMELMRSPHALVTQLLRMKRYGILGRYLPEFGEIVGQMQHDLFHIYTVDAHTLSCIKNMRRFWYAGAQDKFPLAAKIVRKLPKIELLYIAGLYHDIGKGRGGDHSQLGAIDARAFCERHGLGKRDTNLVVWLVENHLYMTSIAQRQDISDPEVIHNFALKVGVQIHLDYLLALTVADVNATNPTLWTSWKAQLMRQLYTETKRALRRGLENPIDKHEWIEDTQQQVIQNLALKGFSEAEARKIWAGRGEDYFLRESVTDIEWHTEAIAHHANPDEPLILIRDPQDGVFEGATQIFVRMRAHNHAFAAVVTLLDQLNLSIQDARLYSSSGDFTNDTYFVLNENLEPIGNDDERRNIIWQTLHDELAHNINNFPSIAQRRTAREMKHFTMPTRTSMVNDINSGTTVLEVISPDRPGLLARIARVFVEFGIRLHNAKITTLGERVEDVFFITDQDGKPLSDPAFCASLQSVICEQLDKQVAKTSAPAM